MLEVMVAIVVLSFGLLGLAGLQVIGLKSNQTASLRSIATQQTYDIADRMRANMSGVNSNAYDNITPGTASNPNCILTGCTTLQMAQHDSFVWNATNAVLLPGGTGTVTGTPATFYTISVTWTEKCDKGESSCTSGTLPRSFSTSFMP